MTYTNHLQPDEDGRTNIDLDRVLKCWRPDFGEEGLLADPSTTFSWRGDTHLRSDRSVRSPASISPSPVAAGGLILQLSVRGKPRDGSLKMTMAFFDIGRERT